MSHVPWTSIAEVDCAGLADSLYPVRCAQLAKAAACACGRKLLLASLAGVIAALALLGGAFRLSEAHSPPLISAGPQRGSCPVAGPQTCSACLFQACTTAR